MFRAIVLSDNEQLKAKLTDLLSAEGGVVRARSLSDAEEDFDDAAQVVFVDLVPSSNGTSGLYRQLKAKGESRTPLIVALVPTERADEMDAASPIDDFLCVPFADAEARARLRRLLARLQSNKKTNAVTVGDLCVDFDNYHVAIGGYPILLTYKEFELLRFFLTHPGRAFSRAALLQQVWGQDYIGGVRTVDVHIRNLRAKLGYAHRDLIQTVRNVGYRCQIPSAT